MSLRFWTVGSKGQIIHPTCFAIFRGLPKGLRREDASDYLLSNTYAKTLGIRLPRRQILLGLATSLAASAALRPARAIPMLIPAAIAAVTVGAAAIQVFKATFGSFEAKNDDDNRVKGYVQITVTDDKTEAVEGSIMAFYIFPANTTTVIHFNKGPAVTTKGDKTLQVAAEDSSDDDDFEAV